MDFKELLLKQDEYAEKLDYQYLWDVGAPLPHAIKGDRGLYLIYYLPRHFVSNDVVRLSDSENITALVTFKNCSSYKFSDINNEVFDYQPLCKRGLSLYSFHRINNSRWIAELEYVNAHHLQYAPESWKELTHYYLGFHDEIFECIATGYDVSVFKGTIYDVIKHVYEKFW